LGLAYDAVLALALALQPNLPLSPSSLLITPSFLQNVTSTLFFLDFTGASGHVYFNDKGDGDTGFQLVNLVDGRWEKIFWMEFTTREVGVQGKVVWPDGTTIDPPDEYPHGR
jgi:hypothetical protein